jgi:hypothetical protein
MVVVAQTIPAEADADCSGLMVVDSMAVRGMVVKGLLWLGRMKLFRN